MNVHFSNSGKEGPHVVITAGVHGDEYEPMFAARMIVAQLIHRLEKGRVSVVYTANPGACASGTRLGTDGLDLARVCPGKISGSPTQIAAAAVSELICKADYYIDMHTGGRLFEIYPLAGYMLHQSTDILDRQRMMAKAFGLPIVWGTDRYPQGRTLSVARDANIPAIYVEYGGGDTIRQEVIDAYVRGCFSVMAHVGLLRQPIPGTSHTVDKDVSPLVVEDAEPDSGHLQSRMPAPARGVFQPLVRLGDEVQKGQVWGYIDDFNGDHQTIARAEKDGIVLFIRRAPFVENGDSLGGILPAGSLEKPARI